MHFKFNNVKCMEFEREIYFATNSSGKHSLCPMNNKYHIKNVFSKCAD